MAVIQLEKQRVFVFITVNRRLALNVWVCQVNTVMHVIVDGFVHKASLAISPLFCSFEVSSRTR